MTADLETENINCSMPIFDNLEYIESWFDEYVKNVLKADCVDNIRVARVNNPDEIKEYMRILNEGC
jgi:hypothetical protein